MPCSDTPVLPPNQSYRTVLTVTPNADRRVDLRQAQLVSNLGKVIDNQEEAIEPLQADQIDLSSIGGASDAYISSANLRRSGFTSQKFSTITSETARSVFPLVSPLDLDMVVSWSIPESERSGHSFSHAIRVGPEFSVVEDLRNKIESAILGGGKQTRTMYEETGRLRKVLLDSVLDGTLAQEDDPLVVRGYVDGAKGGVASLDLNHGYVPLTSASCLMLTCSPSMVPVSLQVHNLSPLIPARYILRLPSQSLPTQSRDNPYAPARHMGTLEHRGSLQPGETRTVASSIWIEGPALVELSWEIDVETGENGQGGEWKVRKTWKRREQGGVWKIDQSADSS